jgi:CubicO group peptidase (beta-lactamase class C family)
MDVEAWLDGFMPYALERGDIAGAVVVVVKDGAVLTQKGYGYSDVAARKPVDPARTLFRAGSVSKLFTWTAVMQLVEQGKLDLDADVNRYLDFRIPEREGKPITVRNLMTHTPGFDETVRSLILTDEKNISSLEQALKHWIPSRVTAAGSTPAYSNYGAALAGYIVQRLSGITFEDYIEQKVFAPLGITQASFRQPPPSGLQPDMSKGYKVASGQPMPFEIVSVPPAGSLSISGAGIAPFMIAHLQKGTLGTAHILEERTAEEMHGTAAPTISPLNSMLLGFYQSNRNGRRVISHGGDTEFFHSDLNLLPDDGVGWFISVNSAGKDGAAHPLRVAFLDQFMARYFPGPLPEGNIAADEAKQHARLMAGRYTLSRRAHTTFISLLNLLGELSVVPNNDGTITVTALKGANNQPKKFKEIAPFVWRDAMSGERVAAKVENGRVQRFGYDPYPFVVFEPVPWWWSSGWLLPVWIVSLVALALTALAWPISAFVRRHYGARYQLEGTPARAHRWIRIASLSVVALMLLWVVAVSAIATNLKYAGPPMDIWISILRILTAVVLIGAVVIALWNAWTVLSGERRWVAKLWSVILALSCLIAFYVGWIFHLPGISANY